MDSETQRMRTERLFIVTDLGSPPILKEAQSCCSEEPPAYAPTMKPSIIDSLAAYLSRHSDPYGTAPHRVAPCPEVSFSSQFSDDDHEELSPISLRISTRINVTCDGNLIALPSSPSDQANSIAKAVVKAIQGQDWATGLPMIDENGRPRPLKLEVDADHTPKDNHTKLDATFAFAKYRITRNNFTFITEKETTSVRRGTFGANPRQTGKARCITLFVSLSHFRWRFTNDNVLEELTILLFTMA
ncbi:hypothetical protein CcaCcLH18_09762 [Colletotrichum camelliae]|nr:hypothetical protein CcaCcLH18_09762 [Colletotrichum camelliae]